MRKTRRGFVMTLGSAAGCLGIPGLVLLPQRPINPPPPPAPAETRGPDGGNPNAAANAAAQRALLVQREHEFRAGVENLYQLSSDLRDEVHNTSTTAVFSVHIYKQTEAIEKLAKQLKNKIKG
jgi:hypothetical protein